MNGSPAEGDWKRFRGGLCVFLPALLIPVGVMAQSNGPIQLTPPSMNQPRSPDAAPDRAPIGGRPMSPPVVDDAPLPLIDRDPSTAVEVVPLDPIGEVAVGALEKGEGLGDDVWQGADASEIERLLRGLPVPLSHRTISELVQRLLLTRAPLEDGSGEGTDLSSVRVPTLVRLGAVDGARRLIREIEQDGAEGELARPKIDAMLVDNDVQQACEVARRAVEETFNVYAQRTLVFCQILAGETDRAGIGLNLLRETAEPKSLLFTSLAEKLLGYGELPADVDTGVTPLEFAMWQASGEPIPKEFWRSSDPSIWRALAATPDASLPDRIEAAELAVASGALPGETLADLYRLVEGGEEELVRIATEDPPSWSARERALLFQNAARSNSPAERATALQRLFEMARGRGGYEAVMLASAPLVTELEPSARLTFFAPDAIRTLLLSGDYASADRWFDLVERERDISSFAGSDTTALGSLLALTGRESHRLSDEAFGEWWQQSLSRDASMTPERAALLLDLLRALGEPVPSSAGILAQSGVSGPATTGEDDGARRGISANGEEGSMGLKILEVAHFLGRNEGADANPEAVAKAVQTLRLMGLERQARRLAIEAAINAGI